MSSKTEPSGVEGLAHWVMLYEPERLISAKRFDFDRTAQSCLEVAMRLSGAEAGVLGCYDKGRELMVVAAEGVDRESVLEDPRLSQLCEQAAEAGRPVAVEGIPAGPALPRAGGQQNLVVVPIRLLLRTPPDVDRERRRFTPDALLKPLGVLLLASPPGPGLDPARLQALTALADHVGEVLTNARLYHEATHDPLTDLYRRTELEQHLSVELAIARHTDQPLALLMVDIDNLSRINQQHGRQRGDKIISRVARLVRAQVRELDACVRYGGEEFAVVLPGTDPEGAQAAAEKIRAAVESYPGFGGTVKVTTCVGAAVFPHHAERQGELLRKADQTLFMAKQEGGNRALLWHRRIPRHALRSDKLIGIITGNHAKDYRNVMMLLDMMVQLSSSERGVLYLENEGRLEVELAQDAGGSSIEVSDVPEVVLERVRRQGIPVAVLGEGDEGEGEDLVEACRRAGRERVICLPLQIKGRQIGCMYFDADTAEEEFEESDLIFMQALARELGNAIDNARLYRENVEQKRALEDLTAQLAQKVQAQATEIASMERNLNQLQLRFNYDKIVGKSEAMQRVFKLLDRITDTDVPVLITGETGTGKELVARSLHVNGPRRDGPFVSLNCSTVTESLMESELFGHVKGSFTGADRDKKGLFEEAHGGTIFLDEVQDMSQSMQRELLRVLQEGEIRRVGGKDIIHVDVRVVSATNRDLREMVNQGEFRQDLFYRLNVVALDLPPLRDRKEDIPLIVERLLEDVTTVDGRPIKIEQDALRAIMRYDWPGNIRELQNQIEKMGLLMEGDVIRAEHVRLEGDGQPLAGVSRLFDMDYGEAKQAFAREYLKSVLARNGGNVTRASGEAGIVRSSFHKMMRKHNIHAKDFTNPTND